MDFPGTKEVSCFETDCATPNLFGWLRDTVPASIEHSILPVDHFGYDSEKGGIANREKEFAAGRHCAQNALSRWNEAREIGRAEDRTPIWPTGYVGSISHSANWVWAAAAKSASIHTVGVDTEVIVDEKTRTTTEDLIGSRKDWDSLKGLEFQSETEFTVLFSAKEAFYKCWYPIAKQFFDFKDVKVDSVRPGQLTLGAIQSNPIFGKNPKSIVVHYFVEAQNVFTVAWMAKKA